MKDIDLLISISNDLSECLECLEKHPTIAAFHLGFSQAKIDILIESMKEEQDGQED